ncbi:DNA internalization-related competence protein ComEC/Rec2 [Limosilactobacillus sp.]|uniref:DNA internalization-related competence protein ComEC/Rec2 n=1 Tax=Limosilactobacillus sp. TaxID=2773925 RepID=UPI003F00CE84
MTVAILGPRPLCWLFTGYLLLRVCCLRRPPVLLACCLTIVVASGCCWFFQRQIDKKTVTDCHPVTQVVKVLPDDIKVQDSFITAIGTNRQSGTRESLAFNVRDPRLLAQFRQLDRPTDWQLTGTIQPVMPATNENEFDLRHYYQQRRVYNQVRLDCPPTVSNIAHWDLRDRCHRWRWQLGNYFNQMPEPLAGYCRQLIIGQGSPSNDQLMADVKRLGIIHLFCISGMHVVLLIALMRWLGIYLWLDRELIDGILILALPLYLIIAGGAPSLVRAVIMAEAGLLRSILKLDRLDSWAVSLLVGMAWEPAVLLSLGGQLSYLLSFLLQVMDRQLSALRQSLFLSIASLPAILSYVFEFHWLSLVISYPMIPLFSFVLFPLVLVSAATYWLTPLVGELVNCLLLFFQRLMGLAAQLPGEVVFGKPAFWMALILFLLTLWCISNYRNSRRWLILVLAYFSCFLAIHLPINGEVVFVDIGQGDCIIIREPLNRHVMMIDTGGKLNFGRHQPSQTRDTATRTSINYLKSRGIDHLDTIYLSHRDTDHIGYLPTVLRNIRVKRIAVPAGMEKQAVLTRKVGTANQPQIIPVTDQHPNIDPNLRILHPFAPGEAKNEDSMVLTGRFGGKQFLFTGDLDRAGERAVIERYPGLHADVLKLGHHGSKTASDERFLDQLQPQWGIISAGRFNRYHHPDDGVVASLHQRRIRVLSTQQYGMIRYVYTQQGGLWRTTLKGEEVKWTLPNCLNN